MSDNSNQPSLAEYLEASQAAYALNQNTGTAPFPPGLVPLFGPGANSQPLISSPTQWSDGFSAEAFVDSAGHIIIAFEGTQLGIASYDVGTESADAALFFGKIPAALTDAAAFVTNQVIPAAEADHLDINGNLFVTGHSLGGAEAEFVAGTVIGITGGATFGAPGINLTAAGITDAANMVDYVDYGDPIGNFGTDTAAGSDYAPPGIEHVGDVKMVGNLSDGTQLVQDAKAYKALKSVQSNSSFFGVFQLDVNISATVGLAIDVTSAIATQIKFHSLATNYAPDLGFTINSDGGATQNGTVEPLASVAGVLDQISNSFPYSSSSFTDTFASNGDLQQLDITNIDGTSDVVNFDTTGGAYADSVSAFNTSNQQTENVLVNNDDSLVNTFYNLNGGGLSSEAFDFSTAEQLSAIVTTFTNGNSISFGQGTYTNLNYDQPSNSVTATLIDESGHPLGNLAVNTSSGTGTVTLADGVVINLTSIPPQATLTVPAVLTTPEQALLGYLAQLGDPLTADQLEQLNYSFLNPTGTAHVVTPTIDDAGPQQVNLLFTPDAPGAIFNGQNTIVQTEIIDGQPQQVTVNVLANILEAGDANISQDTLNNIQAIAVGGESLTLSDAQFSNATNITGGGTIVAADGGTWDLNSSQLAQGYNWNLTATDWSGTVLRGNNQDNQTLTASLFGEDTLEAGDGTGDTLVAGLGSDTILTGAGGDTIVAQNGLAVGSFIQGVGVNGSDVLEAGGDISTAVIIGVHALEDTAVNGTLTLTASEFNSFASVTDAGGGIYTIDAATAGTYDFATKGDTSFNVTVLSNGGSTIIGAGGSETLTASASGNDTLIAGNGGIQTLIAGGGTDTLIGGVGSTDTFIVGTGIVDISAGAGSSTGSFLNTIEATNGLAADSTIVGNAATGTELVAGGDISGATISGINILDIQGSITLTAAEMAAVSGSFLGTAGSTIYAATGGTYNTNGPTNFNMTALSSSATTLEEDDTSGVTLSAGGTSGNDALDTEFSTGTTLDVSNTTGADTVFSSGGSGNIVTALGSTGAVDVNGLGDTNDTIYAGSGTDSILASAGGTVYSGTGQDNITGNGGATDFVINNPLAANSVVWGGSDTGTYTFDINGGVSDGAIVRGANLGTNIFNIANASTIAAGATIETFGTANDTYNINGTLAAGALILDESSGTEVYNINGTLASNNGSFSNDIDLQGAQANATFNINGTIDSGASIFGSDGTDVFNINSMAVAGAIIDAGAGVNTFVVDGALAAGLSLNGSSSGVNTLDADADSAVNNGVFDISSAVLSNIQTLGATDISLTATELSSEFNTINLLSGTSGIIFGTTGGTYSLAGKTVNGNFMLEATSSAGSDLVGSNNNQQTLMASQSGTDTLQAGNGQNDVLQAGGGADTLIGGAGTDTFIAGSGNDKFIGGSGNSIYVFNNPSSTSQYTIVNSTASGASSAIDFGSSIAPNQVAAAQSGNDLVLTIGIDPITIQNYFTSPAAQQTSISFANGVTWTPATIQGIVSTTIAQAQASVPTTVNLGNTHVGGSLAGDLSVTNSAPVDTATTESENLYASVGAVTGALTASGQITGLAAGSTDSSDIGLALNTSAAGAVSGSATLNFTSDGTGVPFDYSQPTSLPGQTVQVTGGVYRLATASIASLPSNIIVHVGDAVSDALNISNTDVSDGYSENLTATVTSTTGGLTSSGSSGEITAGGSSSGLALGFSTAKAGTISGTATVALTSDGTGIDGLGVTSLGTQTVTLNATVNNYAKAAIEEISGGGTLAQNGSNYTLTYNETAGAAPVTFDLGVLNNVTGPSDALSGSFAASTSTGFSLSGLGNFSGLGAGQSDSAPAVTFNDTNAGTYTETITLNPTGSNASGYSGALAPETLTITVNVAPAATGKTYTLTTGCDTVNGGTTGNNTIIAKSGTLTSGDKINGGTGGNNILSLVGGGIFDLTAPSSLTNVETVTAQEGQLSLFNNGLQTVFLRSGVNMTLNVASDTSVNSSNPIPPSIIIYGNTNNSDIINLGSGADQVILGSNAETVNGGKGNSDYFVTSATSQATINGGTGYETLVVLGGGTVAMGNNITGIDEVDLDIALGSYKFTANNLANLLIDDNQNGDTVTLQNATQTYSGGSNEHVDVSAAAAGALIHVGTGTNSTLEITGGGNAIMDKSDTGNLKNIVLDAATNVLLDNTAGLTVTGSSGADDIYAGTGGDTLTGNGGADLYFLNAVGSDIIKDTAAHLKGTSVENFSKLDQLDITNLAYNSKTTLGYQQTSSTGGVLTITSGTTTTQIALLGQYSAAGFHLAKDAAGAGTDVTYSLAVATVATPTTLAAAHS